MSKNIRYILTIVLFAFILLSNSCILSRNMLYSIRNAFIPSADLHGVKNDKILMEIIPAYGVKENQGLLDDNVIYMGLDEVSISSQTDANLQIADCDDNDVTNNMMELSDVESTQEVVMSEEDDSSVIEDDSVEVASINTGITDNIGINYTMEQLSDFEFLINNCYTVDGSTSVTSDDINVENMMEQDLSLDLTGEDYKVLIYHSHGSEAFIDSRPGVSEDTIIGVGDELTRILEEDYGIKVYHDRTVYDMVDGKLDRNYAYTQSGYGIDKILAENPSIEVVLDVHRDGVRDDVHLMKVIDGKPTAQIMFFNGISRLNDEGDLGYLHNPNLSSNLSFSLQMHLKGKSLYGDLMRKIYIGGYCYNLDRKPRASLVEVGAQTNTVQEAKNAMIPLAAILYSVLNGN